jgi:hypothetical protein
LHHQTYRKMNWGTKVVIGMALFMIFIMSMAVKMVISAGEDDLVDKDYYEKGLAYDKDYDQQQNALRDSVIPSITTDQNGISISFNSPVKYKIFCQRPSDSRLDRIFEGTAESDSKVFLSRNELKSGPWNLRLEFTAGGKQYLVEREMMMR